MNITDKEKELLDRWEKAIGARGDGNKGFIRDGIVCEEEYLNSKIKIGFILKQVNAPGESGWKVQDSMNGPENWRLWNNAARWVYGIRNLSSIPNWENSKNFRINNSKDDAELRTFRKNSLNSVFSMNLTKIPGGGSTDWYVLDDAAGKNKNMIKEQYELYDPDLTICGGTDFFFRKAMGHENDHKHEWKVTSRGVWWYERTKKNNDVGYVVSYNHPSARASDAQLFYGLVDAVNEIYQK